MATNQYQAIKYKANSTDRVDDNLTVEEALQININGKPFSITMRTPNDDDSLIRGLLYSEDIYRGTKNLKIEYAKNEENSITDANIIIDESQLKKGYSNSRNFLSASSCGICGKTELEEIDTSCTLDDNSKLKISSLHKMFESMNKKQDTFQLSGGSHAAAAFSLEGKLLCVMEDIGRHNAVDKVIGHLINSNTLNQAKVFTVSGRISYEIVSKAFAAKIPFLTAVSAPSSLAVDFAKELGITLLGFCREDRSTCYSHPQRIS
ncbi:MAG: formate dehydrogenase accessory sulfurtransferase FdhD [Vicingaceae bacterium]|nr:formate dehydrogenase accessory sulfurtransferase FdhD [Vicingaceae bacterium]